MKEERKGGVVERELLSSAGYSTRKSSSRQREDPAIRSVELEYCESSL